MKFIVNWFNVHEKSLEVVISEQVVEYPLILSEIGTGSFSILDFGGFESLLPLQLSAIGHTVTVFDQRTYPFDHPNISVITGDILKTDITELNVYDIIISVSTIEHIGLGHYGDSIIQDADKIAIDSLLKKLAVGGKLMITVPAGRPAIQRGYRVYNEKRILELFPENCSPVIRWFMKQGRQGAWAEVKSSAIEGLEYQRPLGQCPVEAVAFILCKKT